MKFEIGDKVNFICRNVLYEGKVLDFGKKAILIEYTNGGREGWQVWANESELALVESNKLYYVKLADSELDYLRVDKITGKTHTSNPKPLSNCRVKFTEQEIKAIDERYWSFAVPVEDLEEGK